MGHSFVHEYNARHAIRHAPWFRSPMRARRPLGLPGHQPWEDVLGRCRQALVEYQQGPLANYMPYSTLTEPTLHRLAGLQPKTLATMHGSAFVGDGAQALLDLATMFKDVLGPK